ncbi:putative transposase [Streptosporangium album]|uniref:Putative transposase n=1 Tax=Streptosporangium album TaxID=47479 RepID=A0A7W7RZX1_9ACTN|nr:IS200/IS605 family transposase [Streptosporangium album]MBB4941331.1 putative transposase [Streptosporangium album]
MARQVRTSPGAAYDLGYHVVWCPKYRRRVLDGRVKIRLQELIHAKADEHGWEIITLEVMPDHVHLSVKPHPKDSPSYVANQFKGHTSHVLREEFAHLRSRLPTLWSRSYFVASVGAVSAATVCPMVQRRRGRVPNQRLRFLRRHPHQGGRGRR